MEKLIEDFNQYFSGDAYAEIKNNQLEITIGSRTMVISMPSCVVIKSTGPKDSS